MAKLKFYQVDAFASEIFKGNPAGVCPLETELNEADMQNIAMENNLSETAFIFSKNEKHHIRWFTPACEVDLCGHATLASAHVFFNHEGFNGKTIEFQSKSGPLRVTNKGDILELDFPAKEPPECEIHTIIEKALGKKPIQLFKGDDYMAIFDCEADIAGFEPDFRELLNLGSRGLIVTAKGDTCDFVSRFFGPQVGIDEDPVTGSAHCLLTPYWSKVTGKKMMTAKQISARGGVLFCTMDSDRVKIAGNAVTFMQGFINI
ncbi:MAG: isomerase [Denitrovibrio sp.]|nr:MAG: isomerase [Denitrovibrio sp.]